MLATPSAQLCSHISLETLLFCFPHSASSSENIPSGLKHLRVRADVENSLTPSLQCADVCCRVWQWAIHCLEGHCPGEPGPEADLEQVGNKPLRCRMGYVTQSVLASPDRGNLDVWPESRSQADSSSDFYFSPAKRAGEQGEPRHPRRYMGGSSHVTCGCL